MWLEQPNDTGWWWVCYNNCKRITISRISKIDKNGEVWGQIFVKDFKLVEQSENQQIENVHTITSEDDYKIDMGHEEFQKSKWMMIQPPDISTLTKDKEIENEQSNQVVNN